MRAAVENDEPARHVIVRMPYYDLRGHYFLAREASQLPKDVTGLDDDPNVRSSGCSEGMGAGHRRELHLGLYEQVSAVCLFGSGLYLTDAGEDWHVTTIIVNQNAST
jgi:hypothetical protein